MCEWYVLFRAVATIILLYCCLLLHFICGGLYTTLCCVCFFTAFIRTDISITSKCCSLCNAVLFIRSVSIYFIFICYWSSRYTLIKVANQTKKRNMHRHSRHSMSEWKIYTNLLLLIWCLSGPFFISFCSTYARQTHRARLVQRKSIELKRERETPSAHIVWSLRIDWFVMLQSITVSKSDYTGSAREWASTLWLDSDTARDLQLWWAVCVRVYLVMTTRLWLIYGAFGTQTNTSYPFDEVRYCLPCIN